MTELTTEQQLAIFESCHNYSHEIGKLYDKISNLKTDQMQKLIQKGFCEDLPDRYVFKHKEVGKYIREAFGQIEKNLISQLTGNYILSLKKGFDYGPCVVEIIEKAEALAKNGSLHVVSGSENKND